MEKKITVKNNYYKAMSFESVLGRPFSLECGEIKTVDYDVGIKLLKNVWVSEDGKDINPECLLYMNTPKTPDIEIISGKMIDTEISLEEDKLKESLIEKKIEMPNELLKVEKKSNK